MKSKTCCFTGHRILPDKQREHIIAKLEETVVMLIRTGYLYFGVGRALGFDSLCAKTVLHLRQSYPTIKLILVLPCVSQADRWFPNDQAVYREMMRQANKSVYSSPQIRVSTRYVHWAAASKVVQHPLNVWRFTWISWISAPG